MSTKKKNGGSTFKAAQKDKKGIGKTNKSEENYNDSSDDLIIGNIPNMSDDVKQRGIPKKVQFLRNLKKLEREKKLLKSLEDEEKEKVEHLLNVKKALLKSKGERVFDEKSLKKRRKNILKKKRKISKNVGRHKEEVVRAQNKSQTH
ncbi:conserved Plasmodium protein, unknown function [Plasmodium ovale wallikeri]|uniref:Ribosomal RNA-processing protein 14/surfeit locus protein 6 C-terminal domain-containing protein n=2 Tax=Plasmodium ovale TaxID=36330 RepID=A0A1A8YR93_PLAOA|nr:conserved Plasmodium protein, unknown function [Plasmodium ovale wallikeri]SBT34148.1 conserved Plasmodium protein, unknown function [Plasmodium ovale wallikeri]SBT76476.1 conserved Plasmodium protein, unknown function [Plasmodium ovale]